MFHTSLAYKKLRFQLRLNENLRNRLIYLNPQDIVRVTSLSVLGSTNRSLSGYVTSKDIFNHANYPLELSIKFRYCLARWKFGLTWEASGAIRHYMNLIEQGLTVDKMQSQKDVYERLESLDELYRQVKLDRRLKTRFELGYSSEEFDETGGIYVHFGAKRQVSFGGGGFHRLAIAKILQINQVPACIGLVHEDCESDLKEIALKNQIFV